MMVTSTEPGFAGRDCPICGCGKRETILDLGSSPLGDRFCATREEAESLTEFPLQVGRCDSCGHCYVPVETEPDDSYSHYLFHSTDSPGLADAFREISSEIIRRHGISSEDIIVDIGANDGAWLSCYSDVTSKLVAVEPAPAPCERARSRGFAVINNYFSAKALRDSGYLVNAPRLITMNYMFANVPNPVEILRDIATVADDETIISVLTGYHPAQLAVSMFDYVYHEHMSYYSCKDFKNMAEMAGLEIVYSREVPLKGGSIQIELQKCSRGRPENSLFKTMLKRESWLDQPLDTQWTGISDQLRNIRPRILREIEIVKSKGNKVIGYGASHSTTTLSHSLGIEKMLDFIVDDNKKKQNRFSPSAGLRVNDPEEILKYPDSCIIILGWQHGPSILKRLEESGFSGKVLLPFPSYEVIMVNKEGRA